MCAAVCKRNLYVWWFKLW